MSEPFLTTAEGSSVPQPPFPIVVAFVAEHCTLDQAAHTSGQDLWIDFLAWKNSTGFGMDRRVRLFDGLCAYLRQQGCVHDPETGLWTGVRLNLPRLWCPMFTVDSTTGKSRLTYPVSEEALTSALDWLRQQAMERQREEQDAEAAPLAQPPHQASEYVAQVLATRRTAREQLLERHKHYLDTRQEPFMPHGAKPSSAEEIHLACAWMLEWKEEGLACPLVREVLSFLRQFCEHEAVPRSARALALELLQALLLDTLLPRIKTPAATAMRLSPYLMRQELLQWYEACKAKVDSIWRQSRGRRARLAALSEAYPGISQEEVRSWEFRTAEYIAEALAGSLYGLSALTARKVLTQARNERERLMRAPDDVGLPGGPSPP